MRTTMLPLLWLAGLAIAQDSSSSSSHSSRSSQSSPTPSIVTLTGSQRHLTGDQGASVTVPSDFEGSTFATLTTTKNSHSTDVSNSTTSENPYSKLVGGNKTTTSTASGTAAAALPKNTQACNNYVEFCDRRYSNITEISAHNSPFTRANNAGRNQKYGVTQQLNDGIRILQGQAHNVNGTLRYCHTSCDLLDAGPVVDYLTEVATWVEAHPFDVVTIIFGNFDYNDKDAQGKPLVTSSNFVDPVEKSGLMRYIYQPPKTAMSIEDWPTLGELLLQQKRVITFIDYNFDTDAVPWMLWEYYNIWETPYSPTDAAFPCTIGRPEGVSNEKAKKMMYMANHNLNIEIAFLGLSLLIPDFTSLNETNAASGNGSLGMMANSCTTDWGRPPNFLTVDFYNEGPTPGSVFEVAARANNVTYNRACCGTKSLATVLVGPSATYFGLVVAFMVALVL